MGLQSTLREPQVESLDVWRKRAKKGKAESAHLRKVYAATVEKVPAEDMDEPMRANPAFDFTITTGTRDREKDTINPAGWETGNFLKGGPGPVLWAHSYWDLPVAKAVSITTQADRLVSRAVFPTRSELGLGQGDPFFAGTVAAMIERGYLKATSVGFRALDWKFNEEEAGIDFLRQELLEFSIVPVPANPEALIEARSAGIDVSPLLGWAEKTIERVTGEEPLVVPRVKLEAVLRALGVERTIFDLGAEEIEATVSKASTLIVEGTVEETEPEVKAAETEETKAAPDPEPEAMEPEPEEKAVEPETPPAPEPDKGILDLFAKAARERKAKPDEELIRRTTAEAFAPIRDELKALTGQLQGAGR